jgi:hypothetical protein
VIFDPTKVCFGSEASDWSRVQHFRFAPKSRHLRVNEYALVVQSDRVAQAASGGLKQLADVAARERVVF